MEKMTQKITTFTQALATLQSGIELFNKKSIQHDRDIFLAARDSIIKRFKYCADLFYKIIKVYLEEEGVNIEILSAKGIVREAVTIRLLSEDEGKFAMEMIDSRNRTSHIYHQELAEEIAADVPSYYEFMKQICDRIVHTCEKK